MATTNIQGGSISTDPNAMTIGEYVLENIRRLNEAGNNVNLPERERAIRRAQAANLQQFYDTQIKNVKSQNGGNLGDQYANRMNNTFKDMFQKASGVKFGELQGQENQTQMELPEAVKEAMKSFVGSDQNKVANSDALKEQVNNIHDFDEATAAGQGRNTEAAKQAQEAIKEEAERCGMFYVNERWLGGMLTNHKTIKTRIEKLRKLEKMEEDGSLDVYTKKEKILMLISIAAFIISWGIIIIAAILEVI